jgi:hypothetical protein
MTTGADVVYWHRQQREDEWLKIQINSSQNTEEQNAVKSFLYENTSTEKLPVNLDVIHKLYRGKKRSLFFYDIFKQVRSDLVDRLVSEGKVPTRGAAYKRLDRLVAHTAEAQWDITLGELEDDDVWPRIRTGGYGPPSPPRHTRAERMYLRSPIPPEPLVTRNIDNDKGYRVIRKSPEDLIAEANSREAAIVSVYVYITYYN